MKKSRIVRATSLSMSVIIAGLTFFSYFTTPAAAALSLTNIETIKTNKQASGTAFKIVEIAPEEDKGTIGYYVKGYEPASTANWAEYAAGMNLRSERENYANSLLQKLGQRGLVSATPDAAPLLKTGDYAEHNPWDADFDDIKDSLGEINLLDSELFAAKGEIVEAEGGAYDVSYNYFLSNGESIFNAQEWYDAQTPESLKFTNNNPVISVDSSTNTVIISNCDTNYDFYNFQKNSPTYLSKDKLGLISATGGREYTVSFGMTLTPANGNNIAGAVQIWGFDSAKNAVQFEGNSKIEKYFTEAGKQSFKFTAPENLAYIAVCFGSAGKGTVKFTNFNIASGSTNANYVQDINYFEYGLPDTVYGENLFDLSKWASNEKSPVLGGAATAGDELTVDMEAYSVKVKTDGIGGGANNNSHDVYSKYGGNGYSPEFYYMNVKPNTEYEISYDLNITTGGSQFFVFPYGAGVSTIQSSGFKNAPYPEHEYPYPTITHGTTTDWKLGMYKGVSGSYSQRFTTDSDCLYVQIRVGATSANSDPVFSNIQLREVKHPKYYYYAVDVDQVYRYQGSSSPRPEDGDAVYKLDGDKYVFLDYYYTDGSGLRLVTGNTYYTLKIVDGSLPSEVYDDLHPYRAVADGFREHYQLIQYTENGRTKTAKIFENEKAEIEAAGIAYTVIAVETSYFDRELFSVVYVKEGNGFYNFIPDESKDLVKIETSYAFYSGGFTNNEWFKFKVLEATEKNSETGEYTYTFPIVVNTFTPDSEDLAINLKYADLIVISPGLNVFGSTAYSLDEDISDEVYNGTDSTEGVKDVINAYISNKMPIMVDKTVADSSSTPANLKDLCTTAINGMTTGGVTGSVYVFSASDISASSMANNVFYTVTPNNYTSESSPYYPVYKEIYDEQNLRSLQGTPGLEQTTVTEATTIRYILNYQNQRSYNSLDKINILDIEPQTSNASISWTDINNLLPANKRYTKDNINIVTMSVAEFVAKNDDFSEIYDIIYIGSSTDNMNVITNNCSFEYNYKDSNGNIQTDTCTFRNGQPDDTYKSRIPEGDWLKVGAPIYNDPDMQGMYYTNVGDRIVTANESTLERPELGGLLKEDYLNIGDDIYAEIPSWLQISSLMKTLRTVYVAYGGHATMRTSGNDINQAAMERLMDYANSGRPIVISDDLSEKVIEDLTAKITVTQRYSNDYGYALKLSADVETESSILKSLKNTFTYNWYSSTDDENWTWFASGKTCETPNTVLRVNNLTRVSDNKFNFDINTGAYFKCIVSFNYGDKLYNVDSNKLHVTKKSGVYERYYLGLCQPGGKGNKFRVNLRNGDLKDKNGNLITSQNYDYYYNVFHDKTSPKFLSLNYHWDHKTWGSWKEDSTSDGYNDSLHEIRLSSATQFKLKNGTGTPAFNVYLTNLTERNDDGSYPAYSESQESSGGSYRNYLHEDDNNKRCWYLLPAFNWDPEAATPTHIELDSELLPGRIDNCSYMWRFLSGVYYSKANVFSKSEAKYVITNGASGDTTLSKALTIAKPTVEFTVGGIREYPNELIERTLNLEYYIYDKTNPNPDAARYKAEFFVDTNGDGKFTLDEKENTVKTGQRVSTEGNLYKNTYTKQFMNDDKGILPWKLLLTEENPPEGKVAGHTSYEGYAYIKPEEGSAITINAVMILPGAWNHEYLNVQQLISSGATIDMAGKPKKVKKNYWSENEYIGCVFESPVFDNLDNLERMTCEELGVTKEGNNNYGGIGNDGLYHLGFKVNQNDIVIDIAVWNVHEMNAWFVNHSGNTEIFAPYNMLILGFGDSWGKMTRTVMDLGVSEVIYQEGLKIESAQAIEDYIASGRATLFCHDTTNNSCVFIDFYINNLASGLLDVWNTIAGWINNFLGTGLDTVDSSLDSSKIKQGYWNNIVLREVLGLDRYGITYAINKRGQAIATGKDPTNLDYKNNEGDRYTNKVLGRSHMYNYIYDYQYSLINQNAGYSVNNSYLSIKNMLEYTDPSSGYTHNHSIAWVPGTAQVYGRNSNGKPGTVDSTNYHFEKQVIDAETGEQDYVVVKNSGTDVYAGQPKLNSYGSITADYDRYTQGFSDYSILRYIDPNDDEQLFPSKQFESAFNSNGWGKTYKTDSITQVNEGKITNYPYDVNVDNLNTTGMNNTLSIEPTHEQVYQCNMNGDDITVWYCLNGGHYYNYRGDNSKGSTKPSIGIRNNAANAYYIYSRKNMTYTGAGHTNKFSVDEAKLFINTLVAAYRSSGIAPTVSYRDKRDTKQVSYVYVIDNVNEQGNNVVESIFKEQEVNKGSIYFKFDDRNSGSAKIVSANLYYLDSNGNKVYVNDEISKLYRTNTDTMETKVSNDTLENVKENILYSIDIPESIKDEFEDDNTLTSLKLYIEPETRVFNQDSIGNGTGSYTDYTGNPAVIEIVRVQLSDLA